MSSKPENTFIGSVHKHLPADGNPYREKNFNSMRGGTPDVFYSGKKRCFWVEYKFVEIPKRPDTLIQIECSALQLAWLRGRYTEGRSCLVIVGSKEGGVIITDPREWDQPIPAKEFRERLISRRDMAGWLKKRAMGF